MWPSLELSEAAKILWHESASGTSTVFCWHWQRIPVSELHPHKVG